MRKVVKFGGSSLANAEQFEKSEILSEVKRADVLLFLLHQVRDLTGTRR